MNDLPLRSAIVSRARLFITELLTFAALAGLLMLAGGF